MVRETRIDKSSLIYPMFVREGRGNQRYIFHDRTVQTVGSVDQMFYESNR